MYRKYYSYNDMPRPVYEQTPCQKPAEPVHKEEIIKKEKKDGFLSNFDNDDIILVIIAVMLIANDCDDKLLLLALAFVFFSGYNT